MALVETGLDIPAEEDIALDLIALNQVNDLALPLGSSIRVTAQLRRDFDLPAPIDRHPGPGVRERLHAHLRLADRRVVRQVRGVPEHDIQLVEDLKLLEAAGGGGFAFAEDRVGCVDGDPEAGRDGRHVDGLWI